MNNMIKKISPLTEPSAIVEASNDAILYTDHEGIVLQTSQYSPYFLPDFRKKNSPFWQNLALTTDGLQETLNQYPPFNIHKVPMSSTQNCMLRIIPIPQELSSQKGFIVIVTDIRPLEALCENFEERLVDNITAWANSITLFNAFFDGALDATFLIDGNGIIIAANTAAQRKHARSEQNLTGENFKILLGRRFQSTMHNAMMTHKEKKTWTENVVAIDGSGEFFPAEATLRKISFTNYNLYQLILHDLTVHQELKEDLQEKQAEVKEMDIALKQVIKSVEEDRKEMREQLTNQVKKQMLPALERITTSDTPEIREGYKAVIEDQLVDIASNSSRQFDSELLRLSPREMEVCQLVQIGRSGKEIAQLLSMSFETVQTHRKNIRKKLNLRGSKISLFTYLRQKTALT